jgi:hypothetical protein
VASIRKKDIRKDLGLESRVKTGYIANVSLYGMILFGWILKKAVGEPGLH